jgi:hypothetical protein
MSCPQKLLQQLQVKSDQMTIGRNAQKLKKLFGFWLRSPGSSALAG